jgi:hypothetical protein
VAEEEEGGTKIDTVVTDETTVVEEVVGTIADEVERTGDTLEVEVVEDTRRGLKNRGSDEVESI